MRSQSQMKTIKPPLRPIHMVQFIAHNSFLLFYSNPRDDLQISDYDRSCVQVNISCEWSLVAVVTNIV